MIAADYARHMKVLGKFVYVWDQASAQASSHALWRAVTADQVATGLVADQEAVDILAQYQSNWSAAIAAGPTAIQSLMQTLVERYIRSSLFVDTFVTGSPNTAMSVTAILKLWASEMVADSGNSPAPSFLTLTTTGFAHFFDHNYGSQSWTGDDDPFPTAGSPGYPDATYVVATIV